jgi:hypothetical protein
MDTKNEKQEASTVVDCPEEFQRELYQCIPTLDLVHLISSFVPSPILDLDPSYLTIDQPIPTQDIVFYGMVFFSFFFC